MSEVPEGWEPYTNQSGYVWGIRKGTDEDEMVGWVDFAREGLPTVCRIYSGDDQYICWLPEESEQLIEFIREVVQVGMDRVNQFDLYEASSPRAGKKREGRWIVNE
jgi:hypothetical protein